jgi:predicted dehydrogenase
MANEKVIVIGAGGISNAWFPNLVSEQLEVVAVVDLFVDNARKQIDKYKLASTRTYANLGEALAQEKADFAIDLTIPDAHCEVTCAALRAGLHVIGEKPMAATIEQARQMVDASKQSGKLYMVSQSRRWDANHATLARAVTDKVVGRLSTLCCDFFMGCHFGGFRDAMESPLILDMAIHHFDMARMIGGCDPISVYAQEFNPHGSWYKGDVSAACLFEMTGGVRFWYRGSWAGEGLHTSWDGDWRVQGESGAITYVNNVTKCEVVDGPEGFMRPKKAVEIPRVEVAKPAMHGGLNEMLTFLRTGQMPQTHAADNIKSLAMVLAAIKSSREKRLVTIDELLG